MWHPPCLLRGGGVAQRTELQTSKLLVRVRILPSPPVGTLARCGTLSALLVGGGGSVDRPAPILLGPAREASAAGPLLARQMWHAACPGGGGGTLPQRTP